MSFIDNFTSVFFPNQIGSTQASSQTGQISPPAGSTDPDLVNAMALIDTLQTPPPQLTQNYLDIVTHCASFVSVPSVQNSSELSRKTGAQASWGLNQFPEHGLSLSNNNVMGGVINGSGLDSFEKTRNAVSKCRNDVYTVVNKVNAFIARAKNAGFAPPENPFALAMSFNSNRVGFSKVKITQDQATKISSGATTYIKLLQAEAEGKLNLDKNANQAAQLSAASLSLEGFGGTGNTSLDLAKLLPDADEIKAQKAFEALSVFDFTKRIPKVLFTAFYAPDNVPKGVIVGWKKVSDASGYVIKRRGIFDGKEVTYALTNEDAKSSTLRLKEYVKAWILSFYDNVQEEFVTTFLDTDVPAHGYFHYSIQAYQLQNEIPGTIFNVSTSPVFLSALQKNTIRTQLLSLEPGVSATSESDVVSPYPVLAHVLLGDAKYDWLLAAMNIRQSINRGDSRTTTRGYSYLSAQLNFLFDQADKGLLVVPQGKNISAAMKNVEDAISKYGVMQVLQDVLQETGALYHFEGKDPTDNTMFRNVDKVRPSDSGLVSVVASAIDPETATLNLNTLATNLPKLLSGEFVSIKDNLTKQANNSSVGTSGEIEMPSNDDPTQQANSDIQYLSQLGNMGQNIVDLTTATGIATFMRTIRIFSDLGPNRGAPIVTVPTPVSPDPVVVPPKVNAPISPRNPVLPPETPRAAAADTNPAQTAADRQAAQQEAQASKNTTTHIKNSPGGAGKPGGGTTGGGQ